MNLIALPAFTDHCIWMLHDGRHAVVVDPGESAPPMAAILVTRRESERVGSAEAHRPPKNDFP